MDPIPKRVPCIISVDKSVPPKILTDDLKIFRSSLNLLSNACASTETGSVRFRIYAKNGHVVFECEDTGKDINVDDREHLFQPRCCHGGGCNNNNNNNNNKDGKGINNNVNDLGLYSLASQIDGLGGRYGYCPRSSDDYGVPLFDSRGRRKTGSLFWFSIPLVLPNDSLFIDSSSSSSVVDCIPSNITSTRKAATVLPSSSFADEKMLDCSNDNDDHHHNDPAQPVRTAEKKRVSSMSTQDEEILIKMHSTVAVAAAAAEGMSDHCSDHSSDSYQQCNNDDSNNSCNSEQHSNKNKNKNKNSSKNNDDDDDEKDNNNSILRRDRRNNKITTDIKLSSLGGFGEETSQKNSVSNINIDMNNNYSNKINIVQDETFENMQDEEKQQQQQYKEHGHD